MIEINTNNGIIDDEYPIVLGGHTIDTLVHTNIDSCYGPYSSEDNAKLNIPAEFRAVGLTVGIYTDETKSKIKEKWFQKDEQNNWILVDKISNTYYGPYNSIEEALNAIPENQRKLGLTVGIITSEGKLKEMWFQGNPLELVDKIEEYSLILNTFSIEQVGEYELKITYKISGKGLNPVVSISGTNVQQRSVNFETVVEVPVIVNTPGVYTYTIYISDALGTKVIKNTSDTISFAYGTIMAYCTDSSKLLNLPPTQASYEGKQIGIEINYNTEKISDVRVSLNNYNFTITPQSNGIISQRITLPVGSYYSRDNNIIVKYREDQVEKIYGTPIYSFSILSEGQFALVLNNVPEIGYIGTNINFDVNVQYGGGKITERNVKVFLQGKEDDFITSSITLNSYFNRQFSIPETILNKTDADGKHYADAILIVQLVEDSSISVSKPIKIYEVSTPKRPCGEQYFNSNYNDIVPVNTDAEGNKVFDFFPKNPNESINCFYEEETYIKDLDPSFNIDFSIKTPQDGSDTPLVVIRRGSFNLLTIGKQYITSDLFTEKGETYQKNNLVLPKNEKVHIGFGYQRRYKYTDKYNRDHQIIYSCIFINGEIAFCNKSIEFDRNNYQLSLPKLYFNNNFILDEFSYNGKTENTVNLNQSISLKSCITGDTLQQNYVLGGGSKDVFYYNWQTLSSSNTERATDLTELELIPIRESADESTQKFWGDLKRCLKSLGSPVKKIEHFIKFGDINYSSKQGIEFDNTREPELFDISKDDKESKSLDKKYGVLCKYRFVSGTNDTSQFEQNKYCIVQVQGTSTLAYPVPNLQFTFIYYDGDDFHLDEKQLRYKNPQFDDEGNITGFDEDNSIVTTETNLVAKADSMDSSHLNNTPTCIFINSLINSLHNRINPQTNEGYFSKFIEGYLDAIVGLPILVKIDTRDGSIDDNGSTSVPGYKSYGTFMLNTGKSANNMGLNDKNNPVFSLEGQSNEKLISSGSPGMFILPESGTIKELFDKIGLIADTDNEIVSLSISSDLQDDSNDNYTEAKRERYEIAKYLINNTAFESRSNIEDDDILESNEKIYTREELISLNISPDDYLANIDGTYTVNYLTNDAWNKYVLHILRMWIFVNKSTNNQFKVLFEKVFNLDYACLYYINLLAHGQADNLGKNMMIDCEWKEDYTEEIWFIRPYDLDSQDGLTNNGSDDFPVYGCISESHFTWRYGRNYSGLPSDTYTCYNSKDSQLWIKFWNGFNDTLKSKYNLLRPYINPENIILNGKTQVSNLITKEQYNIDFSLKHLGTEKSYLNKGGRLLNYEDWITKRFMYVDSYFSYFKTYDNLGTAYHGHYLKIFKTLIPVFYEFEYQGNDKRIVNSVQYGLDEYQYENPLNKNLQYTLRVVPESIVKITPVLGRISEDVLKGEYKNIESYQGEYSKYLFSSSDGANNNFKNLNTIIIEDNIENIQDVGEEEGYVPNSINKLELKYVNVNGEIKFTENSSIESIYLYQCKLKNLKLQNLSSLKEIIIEESTIEGTLLLSNLKLKTLQLKVYNTSGNPHYINSIIIEGQITINDVIDFSGIKCNQITFQESPTVKELYLNYVYSFGGKIATVYDFGSKESGKKYRIGNTYTNASLKQRANIIDNETDEYVILNNYGFEGSGSSPFERVPPSLLKIDVSSCFQLETFSCIGSELIAITLPTSVKTLNLQYCKKLKFLSKNPIVVPLDDPNSETDTGIDFEGFTNLHCSPFTLIYRSHMGVSASIEGSTESFTGYCASQINLESFNLSGCKSIYRISEINHSNNLGNTNTFKVLDNFGEFFVNGCEELQGFKNCSITFKSLHKSFYNTYKLQYIPNTFNFNNINSLVYAFARCGISVLENSLRPEIYTNGIRTTIQNLLNIVPNNQANINLNANGAFSGMNIIQGDLGTDRGPKVIYWKQLEWTFGTPVWSGNSIEVHSDTFRATSYPDYEYYCITDTDYSEDTNHDIMEQNEEETINIFIKLPYAESVSGMFIQKNININNPNEIFQNNTNLRYAVSFLAKTGQKNLINFTNCTKLVGLKFCYSETNLTFDSESEEVTNSQYWNRKLTTCKLPKNTSQSIEIQSLFFRVNMTQMDVKGCLEGVNINRANRCFGRTNCCCSGNPFTTQEGTYLANIDISSLFYNDIYDSKYSAESKGVITDLSWVTENMITSNLSTSTAYNNANYVDGGGVFEGKIIYNFRSLPKYNTNSPLLRNDATIEGISNATSQRRMFRQATIETYDEEYQREYGKIFTITGQNSSNIFDQTTFKCIDSEEYLNIKIDDEVVLLNGGFINSKQARISIDLPQNNNIRNINSCFEGCTGSLIFERHNKNYKYLERLQSASRAFCNCYALNANTFPKYNSEIEDENIDNINLFYQCQNLTNIDGIFANTITNNELEVYDKINLSQCSNLESMNYAFYRSTLNYVPKLSNQYAKLKSTKGVFRGVIFKQYNAEDWNNNKTYSINSLVLENASELFANCKLDSLNDSITVSIASPYLKEINAASTNNKFNINVEEGSSVISALQVANTTGGNLEVSGNGTLNISNLDNPGWQSINAEDRNKNSSGQGYYILNNY